MWRGVLEGIYVTETKGSALHGVAEAEAEAGRGLRGDRYFLRQGSFDQSPYEDREVTLIEAETLEALARDHGLALTPEATRRNLLVRDVPLNHLVGRDFNVGEVVLRGRRLCEPCGHLGRLTTHAAMKALVHRGGLRAQILVGGTLRVGDVLRPVE